LIAHEVLEFNNLFDLGIRKPPLGFYKFLSLFRCRIEEAGVDLTGRITLDQKEGKRLCKERDFRTSFHIPG